MDKGIFQHNTLYIILQLYCKCDLECFWVHMVANAIQYCLEKHSYMYARKTRRQWCIMSR